MNCKICGAEIKDPEMIPVKEMMFGSRDTFNYFICPNCGCLQIESPPKDKESFYSGGYYTEKQIWDHAMGPGVKEKLRRRIARSKLFHLLNLFDNLSILDYIHYGDLRSDSKILDVGCGKGDLLYDFYTFGFNNLTGIDPYLKEEYHSESINLYRMGIDKIEGQFDLIIFNHSFEHIWEQDFTLKKAREMLTENGVILMRIPVPGFAFEKYRENWVQLDAPRHYFLHSEKSLELLCKKNALNIFKVIYDSTEFQFMGSEQYVKNIPLNSPESYTVNFEKSIFTNEERLKFRKMAKELNSKNTGDQASFFIRKSK